MIAPLARRIASILVALSFVVLLSGAWSRAASAWWVRVALVAAALLASLRPRDSLLILAGLGPLAGIAGAAWGAPYSFREALVLSTFTGWAVHIARRRSPAPIVPRDLGLPLRCVVILILASLAVEISAEYVLVGPAELGESIRQTLRQGLLVDRHGVRGLNAAIASLEGLAVFAAAAAACAHRPSFAGRLAGMAALGAAGAAALNVVRIFTSSITTAAPLQRLRELMATVRVNIHFSDVNAAGSYFAMMFFPAALRALDARSWRRLGWGAACALIFAAAWLTGSRAAVAAILAVGTLGALIVGPAPSWRSRRTLAVLGVALAAAIAFVALFPNRIAGAATSLAVEIRVQMARVSLQMLADEPLFGVGVGAFADESVPRLPSTTIGHLYLRENAHNNVLQWLAELGVVGLAALCWLIFRAGIRARDTLRSPDRHAALAVVLGLVAFGLTALLGHPLLTPDVNHVFWLMLGIAAGGPAAARLYTTATPERYAAAALIALVLVSLPWRAGRETARLDLEHTRYGVSRWLNDENGIRYQNVEEGAATLFVGSTARALDIPLRLAPGAPPATIEITFRNRVADRVRVASTDWQIYRLVVPPGENERAFFPVRLRATDGDIRGVLIGRSVPR